MRSMDSFSTKETPTLKLECVTISGKNLHYSKSPSRSARKHLLSIMAQDSVTSISTEAGSMDWLRDSKASFSDAAQIHFIRRRFPSRT